MAASISLGLRNVINLGNSIIGVSILAMPYCFRKCGIILGVLLLVASGLMTRALCHLLLKSAILSRRRNFEFLAFQVFGRTGKLIVEIGIIGFLIGTCIAFFVVIGDLGPDVASELFDVENTPGLRVMVLVFLGLFVGLPLGLLRNVDSLTSFSAMSIAFYACLILKLFSEAFPNLMSGEWKDHVNYWQPDGVLTCLPIISMALSCQPQLFEIFDTLNDPSLKRMDTVVSGAVHLCSLVYGMVGFLGYVAYYNHPISGNILVLLEPTFVSKIIKMGFILTVVISFPLCLFPCRTSLHSLLCRQSTTHLDPTSTYIPDQHFKALTLMLVGITISTAIVLPNIELVLGFIGSTIGTTICIILPCLTFIHVTSKNTNERLMAQILLFIGVFIMVACSYSTLQNAKYAHESEPKPFVVPPNLEMEVAANQIQQPAITKNLSKIKKEEVAASLSNTPAPKSPSEDNKAEKDQSKRQEPPIPLAPVENDNQVKEKPPPPKVNEEKIEQPKPEKKEEVKKDEVVKKENNDKKENDLLKKLEEQQQEHKLLLEEQKKVLEQMKKHMESHDDQEAKDEHKPVEIPEIKNEPIQGKQEIKKEPVQNTENLKKPATLENIQNQEYFKKSSDILVKVPAKSSPNLPEAVEKAPVQKFITSNYKEVDRVKNYVESPQEKVPQADVPPQPTPGKIVTKNKSVDNENSVLNKVDFKPEIKDIPVIDSQKLSGGNVEELGKREMRKLLDHNGTYGQSL